MRTTRGYQPPYCPDFVFFLGESFNEIVNQGFLVRQKEIQTGVYHPDNERIIPVKSQKVARIEQLCANNPEDIIVSPLETKTKPRQPLVMGKLDIYPNWRLFSIEEIRGHPLYGRGVYMTQIEATSAEIDYGTRTKDKDTGEERVEFIGSSGQFDPVSRGLRTWLAYSDLNIAPTGEEVHLLLKLSPKLIKKVVGLQRKGKSSDEYDAFLERIAKTDPRIHTFIEYSRRWGEGISGKRSK